MLNKLIEKKLKRMQLSRALVTDSSTEYLIRVNHTQSHNKYANYRHHSERISNLWNKISWKLWCDTYADCFLFRSISLLFIAYNRAMQFQKHVESTTCPEWLILVQMINRESVRWNPISVTCSLGFASENGAMLFFNAIIEPTQAICLWHKSHREL